MGLRTTAEKRSRMMLRENSSSEAGTTCVISFLPSASSSPRSGPTTVVLPAPCTREVKNAPRRLPPNHDELVDLGDPDAAARGLHYGLHQLHLRGPQHQVVRELCSPQTHEQKGNMSAPVGIR